ncbi:MAG: DUF5110 domain-containing protein [Candidatus Marinimicrobia bacterium]|nr:DUF5110 domain-containing protein [Candidatus Neomarinimicrobiota bacterium]
MTEFITRLKQCRLLRLYQKFPLKPAASAFLIQKDIALFVPENFDKKSHLPSFALVKEPEYFDILPENWPTKVKFTESKNRSIVQIKTGKKTDLYGTGEVTGPLHRNGTSRIFWNTDNFTYLRNGGKKLYQSHPWVLGVRKNGSAFGVLADCTWKMEVILDRAITFVSKSAPFRIIIIEKETPQEVLKALADLTGKMELPPLWSLGFQQCRWSYFPDTKVKAIANTFRAKKIPCDVLWMDIDYMEGFRVFTFSKNYFPDPESLNHYLHEKGFKSVWMIDPGVKYDPGYFIYDSGTEWDVWVRDKAGENYLGQVWPGNCVFPDFTTVQANRWWKDLCKDFMSQGIDGVWNDMNEPSVFNGKDWTMPEDNIHRGSDTLPKDTHLRYHNVYGMMMVKASREGILEANPDKRPFVLSRANFLGGQRYAATWTGDNASRWKHLKMSIPMSLNLSLSGQPFNGPDIGGFAFNASADLFGHWIATGAFYPFSRAHSMTRTKDHEPWSFGDEIEKAVQTALERRYRLLPYLYTLFHTASISGQPILQPVFFADIQDKKLRREQEAFLLGPDLLVVPRWANNPSLPRGKWHTISLLEEGREKDRFQPELKIRPGAIVPASRVIQTTADYSLQELELLVSLDESGSARGNLYHDAGDGFDYLKNQYAQVFFSAEKSKGEVLIRIIKTEGSFPLKPKKITISLYTDTGILKGESSESKTIRILIK